MDIEKSDVEWLITLIVMILLAFKKPSGESKNTSPKRKRHKRKR